MTPAGSHLHQDKRRKVGDEYVEIDKKINSHELVVDKIGNASDLSDAHLSFLLIAIREYSHGQIPPKNPNEIFKEHRDMKDKLRAAWRAKSYREILQYDYLQPFSDTGIARIEEIPLHLAITKQVLQDSWKMAFRGDSHVVLLQKINAMYDPKPYKNICAIVQSSGTGKSRMVDELAKLVYTLPINVRTTHGIIATYPPPDDVLLDMVKRSGLLQDTPMIDLGLRGEVFMRAILLGSYMEGMLQEVGSNPIGEIIFSKGCKLTTFIEQLFKPEYAQMVLDARPDDLESDTSFSQAFAHSMVRFTHFVKAEDPDEMTSEALFGAFVRGMAFIGHQTHQAVDVAIPVLLNKEDALQESAMSAILIQVKRRVKGHGPSTYTFREDEVGLFPPQAKVKKPQRKGKGRATESLVDRRPYVTLVAEVGIEPQKAIVHVSPQSELIHHPDVHPRYAIVAYGCTGVYRDATEQRCAFLLARQDFSTEHPTYRVPRSRDLMMRLKPVWQRGENSYHWLDSDLRKMTE